MSHTSQIKNLPLDKQENAKFHQTAISSVRTKVEHCFCFATVKSLFGCRRTKYCGLKNNNAKMNMLFALSNLWKVSRLAKIA